MTLIELMRSLDAVSLDSLAKRCDTSVGQLRQVALGFRRANPALAINIERESKGAVMFGGGLALAGMFKAPLEEAKKFQTEMAKFSLYGMSDAVNAESERFVKGMNSIGTSITTNMKLFTEAQGVFRESGLPGMEALEGAKIAAPVLSKIAGIPQGLIVAELHGHAHVQTHIMVS